MSEKTRPPDSFFFSSSSSSLIRTGHVDLDIPPLTSFFPNQYSSRISKRIQIISTIIKFVIYIYIGDRGKKISKDPREFTRRVTRGISIDDSCRPILFRVQPFSPVPVLVRTLFVKISPIRSNEEYNISSSKLYVTTAIFVHLQIQSLENLDRSINVDR